MCCDSSGSSNPNADPNVGLAAQRQARIAEDTLAFVKDWSEKYTAPLTEEMTKSAATTREQQQKLFDLNYPQAQAAAEQMTKYGLPAQEAYYKMVQEYSAPEFQEQQAGLAMGDVTNAAANQQAQTDRALAARGIDPTSGAAIYARNSNQMANTAMAAAAANRARTAAQQLGMTLKSDAANFGRGGYANVGAASGVAGGAASAGFNTASGAIGAANQGGALNMQGYGMAGNMYGQQMGTYMQGATAYANAQAQEQSGLGNFLGTIGGAAINKWGFSDRRLKRNIVRIGTLDNGLPVYEYSYIGDKARHVGVMADEVEQVVPAAVKRSAGGFKMVNYGMLG